ncbi:MAG: SIS domain-containing protein [Propionibacteriaceae bacterium]|nr:SIS domain-containing protein [Propionibacteriaceae bacterium]
MSETWFDDSRLEADGLEAVEELWWLATAGARIRRAAGTEPVGRLTRADRPRGVLVLGAEARLVRAVLEPACPVPFMAWPGPALPAWVGPLDLVVALGSHDAHAWQVRCVGEAVRRGATVIVAAPADSALAAAGAGSLTTRLPTPADDPMAAAIAVLALLGQLELGPGVDVELVAAAADSVAGMCSPSRPIGDNPGKDLAIGLADSFPLIWGGTALAGRASRRIAEALRRSGGRVALAADADELEAVLLGTPPRDVFNDPVEGQAEVRPSLLLLDADLGPADIAGAAQRLTRLAEAVGVRVCRVSSGDEELGASDVERYVNLLQQGRYAAAYLGVGRGTVA